MRWLSGVGWILIVGAWSARARILPAADHAVPPLACIAALLVGMVLTGLWAKNGRQRSRHIGHALLLAIPYAFAAWQGDFGEASTKEGGLTLLVTQMFAAFFLLFGALFIWATSRWAPRSWREPPPQSDDA